MDDLIFRESSISCARLPENLLRRGKNMVVSGRLCLKSICLSRENGR